MCATNPETRVGCLDAASTVMCDWLCTNLVSIFNQGEGTGGVWGPHVVLYVQMSTFNWGSKDFNRVKPALIVRCRWLRSTSAYCYELLYIAYPKLSNEVSSSFRNIDGHTHGPRMCVCYIQSFPLYIAYAGEYAVAWGISSIIDWSRPSSSSAPPPAVRA